MRREEPEKKEKRARERALEEQRAREEEELRAREEEEQRAREEEEQRAREEEEQRAREEEEQRAKEEAEQSKTQEEEEQEQEEQQQEQQQQEQEEEQAKDEEEEEEKNISDSRESIQEPQRDSRLSVPLHFLSRELQPYQQRFKFGLHYNTSFGENLFIIGSIPELGLWNTTRAVRMAWLPGNYWDIDVFIRSSRRFEYKYLVQWVEGVYRVIGWEERENSLHLDTRSVGAIQPHHPVSLWRHWNY